MADAEPASASAPVTQQPGGPEAAGPSAAPEAPPRRPQAETKAAADLPCRTINADAANSNADSDDSPESRPRRRSRDLTPKTLARSLMRSSMTTLLTPLASSFFEDDVDGVRKVKRLSQLVHMEEEEDSAGGPPPSARRVMNIICDNPRSSVVALVVHAVLTSSVFLSIFFIWLESMHGPNKQSANPEYPGLLSQGAYDEVEAVFTAVFTLEFLVRLVIAESLWRASEGQKSLPFFRDVFNWLDLFAILPFYVNLVLDSAFPGSTAQPDFESAQRMVKLFRVVRVFKVARHFSGTWAMWTAVRNSLGALALPMFFFLVVTMLFGTLIYFFEPCYDSQECQFIDIFGASYFAMVSMTTVGYGDQVPTVTGSFLVSVLIMYFGSFFLAMPLAVVGNEFGAACVALERRQEKQQKAAQAAAQQQQNTDDRALRERADGGRVASGHGLAFLQQSQVTVSVVHHRTMQHFLKFMASLGELNVSAFALRDSPEAETGVVSNLLFHVRLALKRHNDVGDDLRAFVVVPESSRQRGRQSPQGGGGQRSGRLPRRSVTQNTLRQMQSGDFDRPEWKDRLFMLLDVPDSSWLAKQLQRFIMIVVAISVLAYCAQSMPEMLPAGDDSSFCLELAQAACDGDDGVTLETYPGCFVNPPVADAAAAGGYQRVDFGCTGASHCAGAGSNFGTASLTCAAASCRDPGAGDGSVCPFSTSVNHPVCFRPQCDNEFEWVADLTSLWLPVETIIAVIFTLEFGLRLVVAPRLRLFLRDPFNWIDLLAILPFYVALIEAMVKGEEVSFVQVAGEANFLGVLRLCKIFRVFKMTRHVPSWEILVVTLQRSWSRLLIPLFFNFVLTIVFAALMFTVEAGTECVVGEPCALAWPPEVAAEGMANGTRVLINDQGELSSFSDGFRALWFVIVSITTVGYGDVVPVTSVGKFFTVLMMVMGTFYNAMPLALVGGTFYVAYKEHLARGEPPPPVAPANSDRPDPEPVRLSRVSRMAVGRFLQVNQYLDAMDKALVKMLSEVGRQEPGEQLLRQRSMGRRVAGVVLEVQQIAQDLSEVMVAVRRAGQARAAA